MKTLFLQLTVGFLLLGLSCRKREAEPEEPINLASCRIVKETYWTNSFSGPAPGATTEELEIEGRKFVVSKFTVTKFSYDEKGRIIREQPEPPGEAHYTTYEYTPILLTKTQRLLKEGEGIISLKTLIPLNEAGLDARKEYDKDGYPTDTLLPEVRITRVAGNVIRTVDYGKDMSLVIDYEYDLKRLNLPNKYSYLGKSNRNLPTKEVLSSLNTILYKPGELYRISSYYQFDKYGRVKRLIRYGNDDKKSGWPYVRDGNGVGVIDYEYECP